MKFLLRIIVLAMSITILAGCGNSSDKSHYRLECKISPELGTDSVSLMFVMEDYNSVCHMATVGRDKASQSFVFEGNIEAPTIACLKFNNDTVPMIFVLEQGETMIDITPSGLVISGGDANHEYMTYLKARRALAFEKQKLHQEYLSNVAPDSTIDIAIERQYLTRDSLLNDSLDRLTVDAINRGGLASKIILDRYANSLSVHHLHNIHKK